MDQRTISIQGDYEGFNTGNEEKLSSQAEPGQLLGPMPSFMYKIIGKEDHLIQKSFFKAAPLKMINRSIKVYTTIPKIMKNHSA